MVSDPYGNYTSSWSRVTPTFYYYVCLETGTWLKSDKGPFSGSGALSGVNFSLINGDCDGDNSVTSLDYSIWNAADGSSSGDPNWDPRADLNGDGVVDCHDYDIWNANNNLSGDD